MGQKVDSDDIYDLLEGKSLLSLTTLNNDILFETKANVYTVFESTFTQKAQQTISSSASDTDSKNSKNSSPVYYIMPIAFIVVCYYQFYWKKSPSKHGGMTDQEAKAYQKKSDKLGLGRLANFEEEITGKLNSQMRD